MSRGHGSLLRPTLLFRALSLDSVLALVVTLGVAAPSIAHAAQPTDAPAPIVTPKPAPPPPTPAPAPTSKKNLPAAPVGSLPADLARAARTQTLLARSGFSPGLIDGRPGRKTKIAIEHLQHARSLDVTGTLDDATLASLAATDSLAAGDGWTRTYRITEADLALVTGPIPEDWNERALLQRSGYADLRELLAEVGWCSVEMVQSLNPGLHLNDLVAGDEVTLPDTTAPPLPKLARMEVNLTEKIVLGFNADDAEVFLTHCSIARLAEKRPVGELHVKVVATNPEYTFDPKDWPEIENVSTRLRIAPGPRNPVGAAWVGLDKPGYGMHGTVRPQDIGKTGSHGCFRLANWDATRIAKAVRIGMPVEIKE
jgi:peptidoglycan hydrolase-like protein with peptidoglycan-binding domain